MTALHFYSLYPFLCFFRKGKKKKKEEDKSTLRKTPNPKTLDFCIAGFSLSLLLSSQTHMAGETVFPQRLKDILHERVSKWSVRPRKQQSLNLSILENGFNCILKVT